MRPGIASGRTATCPSVQRWPLEAASVCLVVDGSELAVEHMSAKPVARRTLRMVELTEIAHPEARHDGDRAAMSGDERELCTREPTDAPDERRG